MCPKMPLKNARQVLSGSSEVKNLLANARDTVPSLMLKHPTCLRSNKPMHHTIEPVLLETTTEAMILQLLKPAYLKTHAPQQEKPPQ